MKKFLVGIMTAMIIAGTLSPVIIGLGNDSFVQKNIASAALFVDTEFIANTTKIEIVAGKQNTYKISTIVKYDGKKSNIDPKINIQKKTGNNYTFFDGFYMKTVSKDNIVRNNNSTLSIDVAITENGVYQTWFVENYLFSNDPTSDKIEFEIKDGKIVSQKIVSRSNNVQSSTYILFGGDFTVIPDEINTSEATISGSLTYKNDSLGQDTDKEAPVNISWRLTDVATNTISENVITGVSGKINQKINFSTKLTSLTPGNEYRIVVYENNQTTSSGNTPTTSPYTFIAGQVDSVVVQQPNEGEGLENSDTFECTFKENGWGVFFCALVKFTVYITTFVPNIIAVISGLLSDYFLSLAIDPSTYGISYEEGIGKLIHQSWKIVRDFSNILFIFALFVAAFMLILNKTSIGKTGFDPKKVVSRVIIMALLVNFSLFFCRMIIQTADIFSHILYNQIVVSDTSTGPIKSLTAAAGIKSISFGLINNTNPQSLLTKAGVKSSDQGSYTAYLAIGFITLFMYLVYIYIFVSMMFVWFARIFGGWIAMILSPLAFVSWSIPFLENDENIGFQNWFENFVQLAFLVPVYLFFVYIALTFVSIDSFNLKDFSPDSGLVGNYISMVVVTILRTMIPLFGSAFILLQGKQYATKMSGKIGQTFGKLSGMATTMALGAATGGTALLGRQTLGRAGAWASSNKALMDTEAKGGKIGWAAGALRNAGRSAGATTFDVRNSPLAMKGFGKATGSMGEKIDLGTKGLQKEGGYKKEGGIENKPGQYRDYLAKQAEERKKKQADQLSADMKEVQEKEEAEARKKLDNTIINDETDFVKNEKLGLAHTNNQIAEIDTKLADNTKDRAVIDTQYNPSGHADALQKQSDATDELRKTEDKVKELEDKIKENAEKQKTASSPEKITKLADEEKQLKSDLQTQQQAKTVAETKKAKADQDADNQNQLKAEKDRLEAEKQTLETDKSTVEKLKNEQQTKIASYAKYSGMTVGQMKQQIEIDKIKAEDSDEGKELRTQQVEYEQHRQKMKELAKKKEEAKKEGDILEQDRLQKEIDDLKDKARTTNNALKNAKDKFNEKYNFKVLEDEIKGMEKEYMGKVTDKLKAEHSDLMNTLADTFEKSAKQRSEGMQNFSKVVSVFSVGRYGGSNFNNNNANREAELRARNLGKGKK